MSLPRRDPIMSSACLWKKPASSGQPRLRRAGRIIPERCGGVNEGARKALTVDSSQLTVRRARKDGGPTTPARTARQPLETAKTAFNRCPVTTKIRTGRNDAWLGVTGVTVGEFSGH